MPKETRILALVGSQRGEKSNTRLLCQMAASAIEDGWNHTGGAIHTEIITADAWNLGPCMSCGSCFRQGSCPQDEKDDMKALKQKIMEADCLILASPVYAAAVSGDMKRLIDRLSGWLHTMPLIGKTAAALSTADSNSGETAVSYLAWAMETMGAVVPVSLNVFVHYGPPLLGDKLQLDPVLKEKAELLIRGMKGELLPSQSQEAYFSMMSKGYRKKQEFGQMYPELRFAEERIWEEQGYFACASMREVMRKKGEADEGLV